MSPMTRVKVSGTFLIFESFGITQQTARTGFKVKSTFVPTKTFDTIDVFEEAVKKDLMMMRQHKSSNANRKKVNLTIEQKRAIEGIQKDPNLICKPSDKGGNIVLMTRDFYCKEALRQLSDTTCYVKITKEDYNVSIRDYHVMIQKWLDKGMIDIDKLRFLNWPHPMTSTFYHLPKIHKDVKTPPGCPIISSKGSLTESMSQYIDYFLADFVKTLPSYIRDTKDFIRRIPNITWESDMLMVVLDITSLYTCINHVNGINAVRYFLKGRSLKYAEQNEMLIEFLMFCLTNIFLFHKQYYRQIKGTAMRTCFAHSYTNLFMGRWEKQVAWAEGNNKWVSSIIGWYRYIDDLFILWKGPQHEAEKYIPARTIIQ